MKILSVSDEECPALWDYYTPGKLADYDLIISCGDLSPHYLSFLVTMARCPVLYVHGNHDRHYEATPPSGCDCIDGQIVTFNGLRILGLGGCLRYGRGEHQYTDKEMRRRIRRLKWKLRQLGGVDIVVTHAPPRGLGDGEDRAHWGFEALRELVEDYRPRYLLHGHVHLNYGFRQPRIVEHEGTQIINAYERYVFETEEREHPKKHHGQVRYKTHPPKLADIEESVKKHDF